MTRQLIIVGGPNGAGKTTFAMEDLARRGGVYLGADAIAAEISPGNPAAAAIEAGRLFLERFDHLIQSEQRLIAESTLAGKSLARMIATAKTLGFQVEFNFIFVDSAEVSLNRVQQRVRNGGHDVPEVDVRRRFSRIIINFWTIYRPLGDEWFLFDNTERISLGVASASKDLSSVYCDSRFARFHEAMQITEWTRDSGDHQRRMGENLDTMQAAVKKAQAASLARGVPICYLIDGVMHYELLNGEITRECPWPELRPNTSEG